MSEKTYRIWVDLDNAPHVLVMKPIIDWLAAKGNHVEITARDYGQTVPLLQLFGLKHKVIGKHAGRCMHRKIFLFMTRSVALLLFARKKQYGAVLTHGSRSAYIPAKLLGIPLIMITDYEHGFLPRFMRKWPRLVMVPEVMPDEASGQLCTGRCTLRKYPGLKEELYVYDLEPDPTSLMAMGLDLGKQIVLIRPPASMAHYHVTEGDQVLVEVLEYFREKPNAQVILLPRTFEQTAELRQYLSKHESRNIRIPQEVSYGPNMIYYSDLVISGGGTMNREAACMGIPVFSIFRGPLGSVDRHLIREGKLRMLETVDVLEAFVIEKTPKIDLSSKRAIRQHLVEFIGKTVLSVASAESGRTTDATFFHGKQQRGH